MLLKGAQILAMALILTFTALGARYEIEAASAEPSTPSCPSSLGGSATRFSVPANGRGETLSPPLKQGVTYRVMVQDTFAYNAVGSRSDGVDVTMNGERFATQRAPEHRYCRTLTGTGQPLHFIVKDVNSGDNSGALQVSIAENR